MCELRQAELPWMHHARPLPGRVPCNVTMFLACSIRAMEKRELGGVTHLGSVLRCLLCLLPYWCLQETARREEEARKEMAWDTEKRRLALAKLKVQPPAPQCSYHVPSFSNLCLMPHSLPLATAAMPATAVWQSLPPIVQPNSCA